MPGLRPTSEPGNTSNLIIQFRIYPSLELLTSTSLQLGALILLSISQVNLTLQRTSLHVISSHSLPVLIMKELMSYAIGC
jgi:hypothetical protein